MVRGIRLTSVAAAASLALAALVAPGPGASPAAADTVYGVGITHNVPIRMTDGVILQSNVYAPTDPSTGAEAGGPFPVILTLTPYGKDQGETDADRTQNGMGMATELIQRGYIHVVVDVRGTGLSGGAWSFEQPKESTDGATVVDWAAALPHSTGVVGLIGQSYAAIDQLLVAGRIGADSPLKAIMPIVATDDMYREAVAPGGVTNPLLPAVFLANAPANEANAISSALSTANSASDVSDLISVVLQHTAAVGVLPAPEIALGGPAAYDGAYWAARRPHDVLGSIVANDIPTMLVGGWRDVFQRGGPNLYAGLQNAAAGRSVTAPMLPGQAADPRFQLVYGPWYHNEIGLEGSPDRIRLMDVALLWFDHWLKGVDNGVDETTTPFRSYDFTAGTWSQGATYPFAGVTPTKMYLGAGGSLSATAPSAAGSDSIAWSNAPLCTPSITQSSLIGTDEALLNKSGLPTSPCNPDDRLTQFAPFATTYTTAPLVQSRVIAGPIAARIQARVSSLDSEWVVRVEDVAPDGTSYPLSRGALLGSQRLLDPKRTWKDADGTVLMPYHPHTVASTSYALPGSLQSYDVEVFPIQATIAAGHRLRVTVSSNDSPSLFPSVAQTLDLVGGVYSVQRGGAAASSVQIPFAAPGAIGAPCTDAVLCPKG